MKRTWTIYALLLGASAFAPACDNNPPPGGGGDLAMAQPDLSMAQPDLSSPPDMILVLSERAKKGLSISPVTIDTAGLTIPQQELIGIGSYLVSAAGCAGCHGGTAGSYLAGGNAFGMVYARNLTPNATSGLPKNITNEQDFITTMQTGKDFQKTQAGKTMTVMPWMDYRWMSTYDLKAIYAYLQKIPAVDNAVKDDTKNSGAPGTLPAMYTDGVKDRAVPADDGSESLNEARGLALQPLDDPPNFATWSDKDKAAFGRGSYLVTAVARCNNCHTNPARMGNKVNTDAFLAGGRVFAQQPASKLTRTMSTNLTGMAHAFLGQSLTPADFVTEMQQNVHVKLPKMPKLGGPMPTAYKNLVDEDLQDIFAYLTKLPRRTGQSDKATQTYARYCTVATQATDCTAGAGEVCNVGPMGVGNECVGRACATAADCDACQVCEGGKKCAAPAAGAACLSGGI